MWSTSLSLEVSPTPTQLTLKETVVSEQSVLSGSPDTYVVVQFVAGMSLPYNFAPLNGGCRVNVKPLETPLVLVEITAAMSPLSSS
jgi:hypothetical protein